MLRYLLASLLLSAMFSSGTCNGAFNDAWEQRNGLLLVEVAHVEITVDGDTDSRAEPSMVGGYDTAKGWYIDYAKAEGWKVGDEVVSILVYNPFSNELDDVMLRRDLKK